MAFTDKEKRKLIKQIMENYPEASSGNSLLCTKFDYKKCQFDFLDMETNKKMLVNMRLLKRGLIKLLEITNNGRYFNCGQVPNLLSKAYDWDGQDCDALVQCAIFGDVVYG